MPKIIDFRFLSQDIIESKLDEEGNSKSYIVDRSNGKEYEIQLKEDKQLIYNVDGNMKILNLQNIEKIEDPNLDDDFLKNSDFTFIYFIKSDVTNKYIFIVINKNKEIYIDGKEYSAEEIQTLSELEHIYELVTQNEFYNLENLYNIQIFNEILSKETLYVIFQKLKNELSINKEEEDLDLTNTKLKLLIQYNETNKEIERLTNNKEKILEKAHKHNKILKARELVRQRVEFNKKWIHYLMTTSKVVHIILVLIVIVMIIYKVY